MNLAGHAPGIVRDVSLMIEDIVHIKSLFGTENEFHRFSLHTTTLTIPLLYDKLMSIHSIPPGVAYSNGSRTMRMFYEDDQHRDVLLANEGDLARALEVRRQRLEIALGPRSPPDCARCPWRLHVVRARQSSTSVTLNATLANMLRSRRSRRVSFSEVMVTSDEAPSTLSQMTGTSSRPALRSTLSSPPAPYSNSNPNTSYPYNTHGHTMHRHARVSDHDHHASIGTTAGLTVIESELHEPEIRTVIIERQPGEPLGLVLKKEGSRLVVGQLLEGGSADVHCMRQLRVGDELISLNGRIVTEDNLTRVCAGLSGLRLIEVKVRHGYNPVSPHKWSAGLDAQSQVEALEEALGELSTQQTGEQTRECEQSVGFLVSTRDEAQLRQPMRTRRSTREDAQPSAAQRQRAIVSPAPRPIAALCRGVSSHHTPTTHSPSSLAPSHSPPSSTTVALADRPSPIQSGTATVVEIVSRPVNTVSRVPSAIEDQ